MKKIFQIIIVATLILGCNSKHSKKSSVLTNHNPAKVTIKKTNGKFELFVNNKPFYIKGAGTQYGYKQELVKHLANSFRTWRTSNSHQTGKQILDEAYKDGLMVTMGIDVARERHGFDYNDTIAVKAQLEAIKKQVLALKDHPALLIWAIGNELNLRATNPKVWNAVNDISKMIHSVDPNHLTTTPLAGISKKEVDLIKQRCPDLDLLSFQVYGILGELPELLKKSDWKGPYIVTEWGPKGHWEVPKTKWGAPIEENSTVKAEGYLKRYQEGIASDTTQCLGSYMFLWGQKQERTPTWYGAFLENGDETETIDVMHYIWNGTWPKNRTPQVKSFTLNNKTAYQNVVLDADKKYSADLKIHDFEGDALKFKWEILHESTDLKDGGDRERRPDAVNVKIFQDNNGKLVFKSPKIKGAYRLFAYVDDGHYHAAAANIPFLVN